jgi:endoglucanase
MFDLMNEPYGIDMEHNLITINYSAAIAAIRRKEKKYTHTILLEGNAFSGMHSWFDSYTGNENAFNPNNKYIVDPAENYPGQYYVINVHQYLDDDASGTKAPCINAAIPGDVNRLTGAGKFNDWLRIHKLRAMVTEINAHVVDTPAGKNCGVGLDTLLGLFEIYAENVAPQATRAGSGGFIGWTGWGAGAFDTSYILALNPTVGVVPGTFDPIVTPNPAFAVFSRHLTPTPPATVKGTTLSFVGSKGDTEPPVTCPPTKTNKTPFIIAISVVGGIALILLILLGIQYWFWRHKSPAGKPSARTSARKIGASPLKKSPK